MDIVIMTITGETKVTTIMTIPFFTCMLLYGRNLQPTSMRMIEKIFSLSVLGATLPKPTEMSPVKQK